MKQHILIIGTGLGGCYLADGLCEKYRVTMVEMGGAKPLLRDRIKDVADPGITYPQVESGHGGTTKVWHNALMEIDQTIFDTSWPLAKDLLRPYYSKAFQALAGTNRDNIIFHGNRLKRKLIEIGFSQCLLNQFMYIPKNRINSWEKLQLKGRVLSVCGEVVRLIPSENSSVKGIEVITPKDGKITIEADLIVLAAGGLGSPLLLQDLAKTMHLVSLTNAGFNYDDHLMAYVGEVELTKPLYKLWDLPIKSQNGNGTVRIPLSLYLNDLQFSFQLRPAHQISLSKPRTEIRSVLTNLRNFPFRLKNYWQLIINIDDIFEILSFKFNLRVPTRKYSILMVSEKPLTEYSAVWKSGPFEISRRSEANSNYVDIANKAIENIINELKPITSKVNIFKDWKKNAYSAAHHSGTARMSNSVADGVCDKNGKVHSVANLFVCDGSLIPRSGFVNTGLTIVALAMRMADYLNSINSDPRRFAPKPSPAKK
jgi:hypothetical protein